MENCVFNNTRNSQIVFQSGCALLQFHQQYLEVLFVLLHFICYGESVFLILVSLVAMVEYLLVVLIYIFLIMILIEHLFRCLLTIRISSFDMHKSLAKLKYYHFLVNIYIYSYMYIYFWIQVLSKMYCKCFLCLAFSFYNGVF